MRSDTQNMVKSGHTVCRYQKKKQKKVSKQTNEQIRQAWQQPQNRHSETRQAVRSGNWNARGLLLLPFFYLPAYSCLDDICICHHEAGRRAGTGKENIQPLCRASFFSLPFFASPTRNLSKTGRSEGTFLFSFGSPWKIGNLSKSTKSKIKCRLHAKEKSIIYSIW